MPRTVGAALAGEAIEGDRRFYRPGADPKIPFEFADAAFRYGHGQIRDAFEVSRESGVRPLFPDLLGFRPVPAELRVEWWRLFDVEGERLGPTGGRIVAEVLGGLIDADPGSYRSVEPDWQPTLPARGARFGLADLLAPPAD